MLDAKQQIDVVEQVRKPPIELVGERNPGRPARPFAAVVFSKLIQRVTIPRGFLKSRIVCPSPRFVVATFRYCDLCHTPGVIVRTDA